MMQILRPGVRCRKQEIFTGGANAMLQEFLLSDRLYNCQVSFTLRDYRPEDFETLWMIDQQCFAPEIAYSHLELKTYLKRWGAFGLVAEAPPGEGLNGIGGYIVAEASRRKGGHTITIDVLPQMRRTGLGSQLLTSAEDRLRSEGCKLVALETAVDNHPAIAFYKRHKYFVVKTEPRYYSNGLDALVMAKEL